MPSVLKIIKGIKLRASPEPKIGIDPSRLRRDKRAEVLNQDPAKKAGLVRLTKILK